MIKVSVNTDKNRIYQIRVSGHSGYSEEGSDIVCAAISTVVQAAILGLNKYAKNKFSYIIQEEKPEILIKIKEYDEESGREIDAILNTTLLAVEDVANSYKAYVKLEVK